MGNRIQYVIERCSVCGHRRKIYPSRITFEVEAAGRPCPNRHEENLMRTIGCGHEDIGQAPEWPAVEDLNYKA